MHEVLCFSSLNFFWYFQVPVKVCASTQTLVLYVEGHIPGRSPHLIAFHYLVTTVSMKLQSTFEQQSNEQQINLRLSCNQPMSSGFMSNDRISDDAC